MLKDWDVYVHERETNVFLHRPLRDNLLFTPPTPNTNADLSLPLLPIWDVTNRKKLTKAEGKEGQQGEEGQRKRKG